MLPRRRRVNLIAELGSVVSASGVRPIMKSSTMTLAPGGVASIVVVVGVSGATPALAMQITSGANTLWIWTGALLAGAIIFGLVGLFIGKASE